MVSPIIPPRQHRRYLTHWLLNQDRDKVNERSFKHPWWQVMCLTGVDYFSTLGYQPGIAALASGALSPLATLILVLVTLFGALPIYRQVAKFSPHGEGSIAMLERLLPRWQGKLFVLVLLGFACTDFIITITLSAADATAHLVENPLLSAFLQGQQVPLTLVLITLLTVIFLKGFQEAIGVALVLVATYLTLNLVVIGVAGYQMLQQPTLLGNWHTALTGTSPWRMIGVSMLLFPKLALGLSGFETGVALMPLVKGNPSDTDTQPAGRIRQTHQLLTAAAVIMSFFLLTSSVVTTVLIPAAAFQTGGQANGRALAYLAHQYLGNGFGTLYDLSTITILWFAGASAMAGLLNLVPRYLPRYGMAPEWAGAVRPLVLVFTAIAFTVTLIFDASVEAQGGAYATGVLVLMSSAAVAVTLAFHRRGEKRGAIAFGLIALVFFYTTIANIFERPDGIRIATFFITAIISTSMVSRVFRSTELRVTGVELDETAQAFVAQFQAQPVRLIAHRRSKGESALEYQQKEQNVREDSHLSTSQPILFLEVQVFDASVFIDVIQVKGVEVGGYRILRVQSSAVPNAIAALLLYLRDQTGTLPHIYFEWGEGNPLKYLLRFIFLGEGDVPLVTREVLRKAEPDPLRRPHIHVSG
jgi:hypothetical protein